MTNLERKSIAKKYYSSVSNNEIIDVRMSPKYRGDVSLKVHNPLFKTTDNVLIGVRPESNTLLLIYGGGIYSFSTLSKFN